MRKKRIIACLLLAFSLLSNVLFASAAFVTLGAPYYAQERTQWCWAACAQMVGDYITGNHKGQSLIVNHVKGSVVNQPAGSAELSTALRYTTGLTPKRANVLSFSDSRRCIDRNKPFVIGIRYTSGTGHFCVIDGYISSEVLHILDPYNFDNRTLDRHVGYSLLVNGVSFGSSTGTWGNSFYF